MKGAKKIYLEICNIVKYQVCHAIWIPGKSLEVHRIFNKFPSYKDVLYLSYIACQLDGQAPFVEENICHGVACSLSCFHLLVFEIV